MAFATMTLAIEAVGGVFTLQIQLTQRLIISVCIYAVFSVSVSADNPIEWEIGVGAGVFEIPYYPGASGSKTWLFPLPYVLYRSDRLEIDRGIDLTLFKRSDIRLDISGDLAVPVNSSDSDRRKGMPDLDWVLQLGPSLEITLAGGRFEPAHLTLDFPLRKAIATDLATASDAGWTFEPRVQYRTRRPGKTGFANTFTVGLRFSTEKLHAYYYDVAPAYATVERPAFDAPGGYSGLFTDYIATWHTENFIFWGLLRYQNLDGAVFEDSPLVEQGDYLLLGAGVSWVFAGNL